MTNGLKSVGGARAISQRMGAGRKREVMRMRAEWQEKSGRGDKGGILVGLRPQCLLYVGDTHCVFMYSEHRQCSRLGSLSAYREMSRGHALANASG